MPFNQTDNQSTQNFKVPSGALSKAESKTKKTYFNKANGYTAFSNKQSKKSPSSKHVGKNS